MNSFNFGMAASLFIAIAVICSPALAGSSDDGVPSLSRTQIAQQDPGEDAGDASAAVVRLGRLEEQIRTLTGQVEQLQYQNRKLDENLRKLQADTDFRFQDLQHGAGGAPPPVPSQPRPVIQAPPRRSTNNLDETPRDETSGQATAVASPADSETPRPAQTNKGDAFDPDANPNAPGAPKPLGTTNPSTPLGPRVKTATVDLPRGPLDLMRQHSNTAAASVAETTPDAPDIITAPPGVPRDSNAVASLVPGGTREEYDADVSLYKQGQFDGAATGFTGFADKYPRDRLVPDAVFLAGESYAKLGRHREAAEQFLRVSTDFGKSPRAPDALLKLGMSLNALGAKDQACATYLEVTRRFPAATADVRAAVDRELKRARCPGNG